MRLQADQKLQHQASLEQTTEDVEFDLFVEALFRLYGYDFRQYSRVSLLRRVQALKQRLCLQHISELIPILAHDPDCRTTILSQLTVNYSKIFRDPWVFRKILLQIFPYLESYSRLNFWVAGCAAGEEAYSLAILLSENGLLERSRVYASDISDTVLSRAASGILDQPLDADSAIRYKNSGGQYSLSDYFVSAYGKHKLKH